MSKIARVINGKIVYSDSHAEVIKPNETSARERRQDMKTRNRKELLQKNDLDYYRAYPEQAENLSDDLRRML